MTECPYCQEADPSLCECPYDREGTLVRRGDLVYGQGIPPFIVETIHGGVLHGEGCHADAADVEVCDL